MTLRDRRRYRDSFSTLTIILHTGIYSPIPTFLNPFILLARMTRYLDGL